MSFWHPRIYVFPAASVTVSPSSREHWKTLEGEGDAAVDEPVVWVCEGLDDGPELTKPVVEDCATPVDEVSPFPLEIDEPT